MTVLVLGAGVDATDGIGLPLTNDLIPRISEYLNTDEGKAVDDILRTAIPGLRFHFDKFIKETVDRMATDFGRDMQIIRFHVDRELQRSNISEQDRNMGELVIALMDKMQSLESGAKLDDKTANLISVVFGNSIPVDDEFIVDFSKVVYTDTFKLVMRGILQKSINDSHNVVLRHVYHNFLDIERLLVKHFIGFYTEKLSDIKSYIYISWMLWACIMSSEKVVAENIEGYANLPVYSNIPSDWKVISFNYSKFTHDFINADRHIYFHGSLRRYIDIANKTEMDIDNYDRLDIIDFITNNVKPNICFDDNNHKYTIPEFMPPVRIKPLISRKYIERWYNAGKMLSQADKIVIAGYSFDNADEQFNGILREICSNKPILIIDTDVESVIGHLQNIFNTPEESRFSNSEIQGHLAKNYQNISIVKAKAHEINLQDL